MFVLYVQAAAGFIHGTLKNTSMGISNLMGPVEQMALANHPVRGLYFTVVGVPQVYKISYLHIPRSDCNSATLIIISVYSNFMLLAYNLSSSQNVLIKC